MTPDYRAPEVHLDLPQDYCKNYTAIDMWSVGCVMVDLIKGERIFVEGDNESELDAFFKIRGMPTEETWPGGTSLPGFKSSRIVDILVVSQIQLLIRIIIILMKQIHMFQFHCKRYYKISKRLIVLILKEMMTFYLTWQLTCYKNLLCLNPKNRISARVALKHPFFNKEEPSKLKNNKERA